MSDHIRYDVLVQEALRGMVRDVLTTAAKNGLPGEHHFFITFDTTADGVRMSDRLRAQYPEEMTVVLQHQFWDLKVTDKAFEVGLSFGGVAERLYIPLDSIRGFADPSVQFGLQFEELTAEGGEEAAAPTAKLAPAAQPAAKTPAPRRRETTPAPPAPAPAQASPVTDVAPAEPSSDKSGAEVVRLDRFRKK